MRKDYKKSRKDASSMDCSLICTDESENTVS